ncbi:MAG: KamA family radical SAM protein [Acidobacteriota bacterium]
MKEKEDKYVKRWKKLWHVAPDIYQLLKECKSIESARQKVMNYLNSTEMEFRNDYYDMTNSQFILFKNALNVLKNVFSKKYERISSASSLKYIWSAARKGDSDVANGFIDEFEHLFRALKGHSKVYPSHFLESIVVSPEFDQYKGRKAAVKRSDYLDKMGDEFDKIQERYPDTLSPEVQKLREENKQRVLKEFGGNEDDWSDYKWHYRNIINTPERLDKMKKIINISDEQEKAIKDSIKNRIPFGLTPYYLSLMDQEESSSDFPLRMQVFPPLNYIEKMISHSNDKNIVFDFMREHDTSPVDGITRRYMKVAILKPYDTCPQICVYCQRNWEITSPNIPSHNVVMKDLDKAVEWIRKHEHIMDILVTGGDPLIMHNKAIDQLLERLSSIPHLKSIRIASRTPVTIPQRINDELIDIFKKYNEPGKRIIYFVTHFQDSYEISNETLEAVSKLNRNGINVYNQQVFTFSNSRRFESVALRIALKMIGIDPYYTFNMKGKSEMEDYAVPIARLLQERKEEARLLPGIYRSDEPVFNVPFLGKNHLRGWQDHELISILPDGRRAYAFHPWEKNIREVNSYIYRDVSIREYLDRLESIGEDSDEYRSIWYYY